MSSLVRGRAAALALFFLLLAATLAIIAGRADRAPAQTPDLPCSIESLALNAGASSAPASLSCLTADGSRIQAAEVAFSGSRSCTAASATFSGSLTLRFPDTPEADSIPFSVTTAIPVYPQSMDHRSYYANAPATITVGAGDSAGSGVVRYQVSADNVAIGPHSPCAEYGGNAVLNSASLVTPLPLASLPADEAGNQAVGGRDMADTVTETTLDTAEGAQNGAAGPTGPAANDVEQQLPENARPAAERLRSCDITDLGGPERRGLKVIARGKVTCRVAVLSMRIDVCLKTRKRGIENFYVECQRKDFPAGTQTGRLSFAHYCDATRVKRPFESHVFTKVINYGGKPGEVGTYVPVRHFYGLYC